MIRRLKDALYTVFWPLIMAVGSFVEAKPINDTLSQTAIINANKLIKTLRNGWRMLSLKYRFRHTYDPDPEYITKLIMYSISQFNKVPPFTSYSLEDTEFIDRYHSVIIHSAFMFSRAHRRFHKMMIGRPTWAAEDLRNLKNTPFPTLSWMMKTYNRFGFSPFEWVDTVIKVKTWNRQ